MVEKIAHCVQPFNAWRLAGQPLVCQAFSDRCDLTPNTGRLCPLQRGHLRTRSRKRLLQRMDSRWNSLWRVLTPPSLKYPAPLNRLGGCEKPSPLYMHRSTWFRHHLSAFRYCCISIAVIWNRQQRAAELNWLQHSSQALSCNTHLVQPSPT